MVSYGLGHAVDEMADTQIKVVEGIKDTGKAGKIVLTLKYKRNGKHGIDVDYDIKPTIPKMPGKTAPMFVDDENLLHDQDPLNKQTNFENVTDFTEHKNRDIKEG